MTEESNKTNAAAFSELPLDFESRQSFAEPPQAPFRPKPEPAPAKEAAAAAEPLSELRNSAGTFPAEQSPVTGGADPVPEDEIPAAGDTEQQEISSPRLKKPQNSVLPGTAPVPPPGTPVRKPAPIIAAGHRNVGIATQSIGTGNRGPVVSLSANQLPGAEKPVEILPYGRIFAEARKRSGKTLEEVGNLTLIRSDYIKALECEDLDNLPAVTYVIAYARKLGKLYNMPKDEVSDLVATIRSRLEYVVPEELILRLGESGDPSEENIRTIRKFMFISGTAVGVIFLIIAGIVAAAAWGTTDKPESSHVLVSDRVAGELIAPPTLEMQELPPQ